MNNNFIKLYEELSLLNEAIVDCPYCGNKLSIEAADSNTNNIAAANEPVITNKRRVPRKSSFTTNIAFPPDTFKLTWRDEYIDAAGGEETEAVGLQGIADAIKEVCGFDVTVGAVKNWISTSPHSQS